MLNETPQPEAGNQPSILDDDDDLLRLKKIKQAEKPKRYDTPPIWAQKWIPPHQANHDSQQFSQASGSRISDKPVFDYTSSGSIDLQCSITGIIPPSSITRTIAEWIFANFSGIEERNRKNVELELKFGKIIDKRTGSRLNVDVITECIFTNHSNIKFDMEVEELAWKEVRKLFEELEQQFQNQKNKETTSKRKFNMLESDTTDSFYQIGVKNEQFRKVRISKDNSLNPPRYVGIQKERISDMYIHNPQSMYDLRLSLSLELPVPEGNIESIMKKQPDLTREKKRSTWTHAPTLTQFDLTKVSEPKESKTKSGKKVIQHDTKYEVELEIEVLEVFNAIEKITSGIDNFRLEEIVEIFLNNARVLNNRVTKLALA